MNNQEFNYPRRNLNESEKHKNKRSCLQKYFQTYSLKQWLFHGIDRFLQPIFCLNNTRQEMNQMKYLIFC